jgi:hypothetical protein
MIYNTKLSITLVPEGVTAPKIRCSAGNADSEFFPLLAPTTINFDLDLDSDTSHKLVLEFAGKTNETADQAVIIEAVSIEGLTLDRFKWAGKYYPIYPEPWASEQEESLPAVRENATYLGWNGSWELEFTVPIFTWVHQLENLGWIYR